MADDPFKQIIEDMRARLQAELDGQVQALQVRQDEAVAHARREAETDADARWASRLEAQKAEWAARLEAEVAAARADVEKRFVDEAMRLRTEAETALASERDRAREELDVERRRAEETLQAERTSAEQTIQAARASAEQTVQTERERAELEIQTARASAEQDVQAERRRAAEELKETRAALEAERDAARTAEREERERAAAARRAELDSSAIVAAVRGIDGGRTLSEVLGAIVRGAAAQAPRVALFVANGSRLDEWPIDGITPMARQPVDRDGAGMLASALADGDVVSSDGSDPARIPPGFAALPAGRRAVAVPLLVGGQSIGVLYADEGVSAIAKQGWMDGVELVARHGAAALAHLTAARAIQLLQGGNGHSSAAAPPDDDQSARRYAKLLVSEIKLYNEGAVRVGREKRDLLHRLRAEIERARRLYDERVPPSVPARAAYFQQELVQTLAGGDPALLGA